VDAEIQLRFLAIFFSALLLLQALLLLSWVAARGVLRGIAAMRRVPAVEPARPPAATAQPRR
jgi:hypothetical protein